MVLEDESLEDKADMILGVTAVEQNPVGGTESTWIDEEGGETRASNGTEPR